jgi:hypothetical protein
MADLMTASPYLMEVAPDVAAGVRPGDIILHCGQRKFIIGLNEVLSAPADAPQPREYPPNRWLGDGLRIETIFYSAPKPVWASEVQELWAAMRDEKEEFRYGPFHFGVAGMLYPVDGPFAGRFFDRFGDRFSALSTQSKAHSADDKPEGRRLGSSAGKFYQDLPLPPAPDATSVILQESRRVMRFLEASLLENYQKWLGRALMKRFYPIIPSNEIVVCDAFDEQANELIEAKSSSGRSYVRMALGQLLDYQRHQGLSPTLVLLVPERPNPDLLKLMHQFAVSVVYRDDRAFTRIDPC